MINTCHLGSSPLFPRGDLRGVATVESTLAGPPCSPPLEKGGRAESLPVQFLHTFPLRRGRGRQAPGWVVTSGHDPPELCHHRPQETSEVSCQGAKAQKIHRFFTARDLRGWLLAHSGR